MKKFIKIFIGLGVVVILAISAIFYFTSDMTGAADDFFMAVKNKNIDKAYTMLSEDFKAATSQTVLKQFLDQTTLSQFKKASWSSRSSEGNTGTLKGSITTQSGDVIPVIVSLLKKNDKWQIYSIQKTASGIKEKEPEKAKPVSDIKKEKEEPIPAIMLSDKEFVDFGAVDKNKKREWTLMVYLDGDNDLERFAMLDFNEMEHGLPDSGVTVVALVDRAEGYDDSFGDWKGARVYELVSDKDPKKLASKMIADLGEINMGDPSVLSGFVSSAIKKGIGIGIGIGKG